jgi:hypothetical protein
MGALLQFPIAAGTIPDDFKVRGILHWPELSSSLGQKHFVLAAWNIAATSARSP